MFTALVDRAAERYRPAGRWAYGFARGKMSGDPVYAQVLDLLPAAGTLVDVGCGEGYLLALVREARPALHLVGLDHDPRRVGLARRALADLPDLLFADGDVRTAPLPPADVLTCLDVLHYLPVAEQDLVLRRFADALRPGGVLLVRDGEAGTGWRSLATLAAERMLVGVGRHRGVGVFFRPPGETAAVLRGLGLEVEVVPCRAGTPFANVLTRARRPDVGRPAGYGAAPAATEDRR